MSLQKIGGGRMGDRRLTDGAAKADCLDTGIGSSRALDRACPLLVVVRQLPFCFFGTGQRANQVTDEDDTHYRNCDNIHVRPVTAALTGLTDSARRALPLYVSERVALSMKCNSRINRRLRSTSKGACATHS